MSSVERGTSTERAPGLPTSPLASVTRWRAEGGGTLGINRGVGVPAMSFATAFDGGGIGVPSAIFGAGSGNGGVDAERGRTLISPDACCDG
jgi:hypothetical protein